MKCTGIINHFHHFLYFLWCFWKGVGWLIMTVDVGMDLTEHRNVKCLMCMRNLWIYEHNQSCSSAYLLSVWCGKNCHIEQYRQTSQPYFSYVPFSATILCIIITTFSELDLGWGSQGQQETRPVHIIFSLTFDLITIKFDNGVEATQREHPSTTSEGFVW